MICSVGNSIDRIPLARYEDVIIFYEDNQIIVAYKPSGVLSQADGSSAPDMLNVIKSYLKKKYNKPGQVFLGLVHRLDRPVSGIMVFAKTSKAASRISEQIRNHTFIKHYRLLADGQVGQVGQEGEYHSYICKDVKKNISRAVSAEVKDSKECRLLYKVMGVGEYRGRTLSGVEVVLLTGRSHQIRVQFAEHKHALIGDAKYNNTVSSGFTKDICLESCYLSFIHPTAKEIVEFKLSSENNKIWETFISE